MTVREPKTISISYAVLLLFVSVPRLVAHSVDHAIRLQPGSLAADREKELRASFDKQFHKAVLEIRASLYKAFFLVGLSIVCALITAGILKWFAVEKTQAWNLALQFSGIGILLWATLGRVESGAVKTLEGVTLPERVDLLVYCILYIAGSYALALSVAW